MKILFVCLGNSERSVIAEELYNKKTNSHDAKSAGVSISSSPRSDLIFKLMKEENIDISNKPKNQLEEKLISEFDKVYVLCKKEKCPDYLFNSDKVTFWNVENPYKKDYDFLLNTKKTIEKYLKTIL